MGAKRNKQTAKKAQSKTPKRRRSLLLAGTAPTVRRVEILPYHTLGLFKWQNLGIPYPLDGVRVPTAEEVETAERLLHVRDYPDAPKGSTTK